MSVKSASSIISKLSTNNASDNSFTSSKSLSLSSGHTSPVAISTGITPFSSIMRAVEYTKSGSPKIAALPSALYL